MSDQGLAYKAKQQRRIILNNFETDLHLRLSATNGEAVAIDDNTPVSYILLKQIYEASSENLERLCPLAMYSAEMNIVSNSLPLDKVLKTIRACVDCRDDLEDLLDKCEQQSSSKLNVIGTNNEQSRPMMAYSKLLAHTNLMLDQIEDGVRQFFRSVVIKNEQAEQHVQSWKQYVIEYIDFVVNPSMRKLVPALDVLDSSVLGFLRDPQLCEWMDYRTSWIFLQSFEQLSTLTPKGRFIERSGLVDAYALSAIEYNFTPAFLNTLWRHMIEIGWVASEGLDFVGFLKLRRIIYHVNHVHGRRFLFDALDINKDGRIAAYEFGFFYKSLHRCYMSQYPAGEFPEEEAAFISWLEQIKPDCESIEQGVSFDDLKHHPFGAEFMLCLISTRGYDQVEYRFEEKRNLEQDTVLHMADVMNNDELDTMLGPTQIMNASI